MSSEKYAFTVINRAAEYVMEEFREPTPKGHVLSYVGGQIRETRNDKRTETQKAADSALSKLHEGLGFTAVTREWLGTPKVMTCHDKIGYFFRLQIPGDEIIETIRESRESQFIIRTPYELLEALREQRLMELSAQYTERDLP